MRSAIGGFALGILFLQQQANLMGKSSLTILILSALLILYASFKLKHPVARSLTRIVGGAFVGWSWASIIALHGLSQQLTPELEEQDITIIGVVTSLPAQVDQGRRFQFEIEHVLTPNLVGAQLPKKVLLTWYDAKFQSSSANNSPIQPGERWQFNVHLRRPKGLANPYGYDYEARLLEQGIGATGGVRIDKEGQPAKNRRLSQFVFSIHNVIEWWRGVLRDRIMNALPDQPNAGVIVALVIGDQNGISQDDWKVFARTGVSHLIAISGLHISMVSGMATYLMFHFWRHSLFSRYSFPLLLPAQKAAALFGVLIALLYVALAGFGVPAQRTLIMISVVAASAWLDRKISVNLVLFLALGLVLLFDPYAVLWPGFWLSFGAVGFIFYASQGRHDLLSNELNPLSAPVEKSRLRRLTGRIRQASITQYAITLGLLPLTLLLFYQVSLVSPLANAVAIPVVSLLVAPLSLIGCIMPDPISVAMLFATNHILTFLFAVLAWLNEAPFAVWRAPRPEFWMFVCAVTGTVWCLAPKGWPSRWAGLIAWLPLCVNSSAYPKEGSFNVTAFDVGQGMALLVETAHHRMLYDTGPVYSANSDAGSRVIYPYLSMRGINRLDGLMISHNDTDHSGGAVSLLRQIKFDWVISSLNLESPVVQEASLQSHHSRCLAGREWDWDGVHFEILHPSASIYDSEKWKPNAKSCTLKITRGSQSILLAGDIEAVQEDELVHSIADKLPSSVLLAPHHGSGTSSTLAFLQSVAPHIALFQLGYHNRYHHPKPEVWQRYGDLGITRLRNDRSGAITLHFADAASFDEYRISHARYWYPSPERD
jgi:competence protein ComEC